MSIQGREVKVQPRFEKSAKGHHESQGIGPLFKKTRGGGLGLKSGVERAGPSEEETGPGHGFKKNKGGSNVKSGVERTGPSGEEQESEDQPFLDQQTEDKGELMEKGLEDPDNMRQARRNISQKVHGPQIIWMSPQKSEDNSEEFEDNIPDQIFQLRSDDEGFSLLHSPTPIERPSSGSCYTQPSPAPIQPEMGAEAPEAPLVQNPAIPLIHRPGKTISPEKESREEGADEEWKETGESSWRRQLQAWGTPSHRPPGTLNIARTVPLVPRSPEKNWKKTETLRSLDRTNNKARPLTASTVGKLVTTDRPHSSHTCRKDNDLSPNISHVGEWQEEILTQKQEDAFREYFKFFCGPGEIDIHSLKKILSVVGISRTSTEMSDALISADVNGDGHVDFRDFLNVLTDTWRFCRSVEQNSSSSSYVRNPHTLFFEVLSLLVEMLALPEASMEEITNYYQKKMKSISKYKEPAGNSNRQHHPHKRTFSRTSESLNAQERKVLNILDRIKRQNHSALLQSPYASQGPNYPLCPRLDKKATRRKQGSHIVLEEYKPIDLTSDFRNFFQMGPKGGRWA